MELAESPWTLPVAAVTTRPHRLRGGCTVQLWQPADGETHLAAWYLPLAALCRDLWPGAGDELVQRSWFLGRVEHRDGPVLWLYVHQPSGVEVLVDVDGVAHAPVADRRRRAGFRFDPLTPRRAVLALPALDPADGDGARVLPLRRR